MLRGHHRRSGIILITLIAMGCGGGPTEDKWTKGRAETFPTRIHLTLDDLPLEGATVSLASDSSKAAASGMTDVDGWAEITTWEPGDGAVAGKHVVTVKKVTTTVTGSAPEPTPDNPFPMGGNKKVETKSELLKKYGMPKRSGLSVSVAADGENEFELALSSKK